MSYLNWGGVLFEELIRYQWQVDFHGFFVDSGRFHPDGHGQGSSAPYRPHPHSLVGKEGCKKGVCTLELDPTTMTCCFSSLGIQCVKRKEIESALQLRQQIRVDPFQSKTIVLKDQI